MLLILLLGEPRLSSLDLLLLWRRLGCDSQLFLLGPGSSAAAAEAVEAAAAPKAGAEPVAAN